MFEDSEELLEDMEVLLKMTLLKKSVEAGENERNMG